MDILGLEIILFTGTVNILLGLFTFLRSPKSFNHIVFFILTISISLWIASNYLLESTALSLLANNIFNRLAYFFGFSCLAITSLFCYSFAIGSEYIIEKKKKLSIIFAGVTVFSLSSFVAGKVYIENGVIKFTVGPLIIIYSVILLSLLILSGIFLRKAYRRGANYQSQAKIMLFGFAASVATIIVLNLILPAILGNFDTAKFGPIFTLFFVGSFSYAILRHKLFDIRLIVARALGYVLSITVLGFFYGLLAFSLVTDIFLRGSETTLLQRTVYSILAITIAFTFQPIKRFFARWTNKLFYQDAYESQVLIDELNRTLVSTIDLNKMLKDTALIIEKNIKPEFCVFVLKETELEPQRVIGNVQKKFDKDDVSLARTTLPQLKKKVVSADLLEDDSKSLQQRMQKNNVAVLVRLTTDIDTEGIGAIVLGAKKSGNAYNSQDMQVLEIVANSLVIAIDNALRFEEIQKFNITLEQKVDDATRKLRRANDKLIALDQTKDDFISMASHQLRTPLTSVKGYLSMVLEGDTGKVSPKQAKMLEQAFTSSQRMVYLIADLLNVSRLRTGKFVIESKPTNLAEVIKGEIGQLMTTAAGKNQKLTYDKPKNFPTLMIDETKIRQVIMNFTDNALHYTQGGGKIHVSLEEKPDSIQFTVTDNGIGIPRHEQHHLFTKFFRAGNARKARPDGTGLGLFMAKKVIIAQGGSLIFKSQEGKGSTFGFTFAKSRLQLPDVPKPAVDKKHFILLDNSQ